MPSASAVHRAESLKSDNSDTSQSKRVSFNNQIDVKHIHRLAGYAPADNIYQGHQGHPGFGVFKEPPKLSEEEIAREAERIIHQVDQISCTVSPTPLTYDTRSLERKSRKNNQNEERNNWSRTLPSASTKNKLETKNNNVQEKNFLNKNQNFEGNRKLDPILETSREAITDISAMDSPKDVFSPKYDSGIEMEAQHGGYHPDKPPLGRNNVNLIVQQLTEESRHREQLRKKYEEEGIDVVDIAPRMPRLSIVEPDPSIGLSHNRNLPFSYTGGSSPTRLSPLRSSMRPSFSPPREEDIEDNIRFSANDTSKRALHVVLDNPKGKSPERNIYRSLKSPNDKISPKFFHTSSEKRDAYDYVDDDVDEVKARFLFGDQNPKRDQYQRRYQREDDIVEEPSSLSYPETIEDSEIHYKSYKKDSRDYLYNQSLDRLKHSRKQSSKILERQPDFSTKVLQTTDKEESRVFRYSDDEDYINGPESYNYYIQQENIGSSPEPFTKRFTHNRAFKPQESQINPTNYSRYNEDIERSRRGLHQRRTIYNEDELDEPPKPPVRTKRRLKPISPPGGAGIARKPEQNLKFSQNYEYRSKNWSSDIDIEESRNLKDNYKSNKVNQFNEPRNDSETYRRDRLLPDERSNQREDNYRSYREDDISIRKPSREDQYRYNIDTKYRLKVDEVDRSSSGTAEPVKKEKIQRQRGKFLAAFLGIGKSKQATSTTRNARDTPDAPAYAQRAAGPRGNDAWEEWEERDYTDTLKRDEVKRGGVTRKDVRGQRLREVKGHEQRTRWESDVRVADDTRYAPQRRHVSPDRLESSESDETRAIRLRDARYKSQSYSNLHYRRDRDSPVDDIATSNWTSSTLNRLDHRASRHQRDAQRARVARDARPYASTNMLAARDSEERVQQPRYFGDTDRESRDSQRSPSRYPRYDTQPRKSRNASSAAVDVGGTRKGTKNRLVASTSIPLHSSASDASVASVDSAASQRSVYLHAATVADIPVSRHEERAASPRRATRTAAPATTASSGISDVATQRRAKHTSRSFSVLSPWKPRHYRERYEITYTNNQMPVNNENLATLGKPPRPPRRREDYAPGGGGVATQRGNAVNRSSTIPKNSGFAGWFRKKKR